MCSTLPPPPPHPQSLFNHFSKHVSHHCCTFCCADVRNSLFFNLSNGGVVASLLFFFLFDHHYPESLWMFSSHFLPLCCCSLRDTNYSLLLETLTSSSSPQAVDRKLNKRAEGRCAQPFHQQACINDNWMRGCECSR